MIEYDQEPASKKKKRKKQTGNKWLVPAIVAGAFLVIGIVVVVVVVNLPPADKDAQAKGNGAPVQPQPAPPDPHFANRGLDAKGNQPPKGLVQGVRAAAFRPERLNELRQIGIFFTLFVDQNNGKNPRTDDEFIDSIKRDSNSIAQALKEKYYILNLKVNMRDANAVIAYESLTDQGGYQSVRVDHSVSPIPLEELKKLLAQP